MNYTKPVLRITVSLLCAALLVTSMPLRAAGLEELRHEAFLRGGNAITTALNAPSEATPLVSKAVADAVPAVPPVPAARPQAADSQKGMSKWMLATLIGGFAVGGIIVYRAATGPGASVRNCSTCK